MSRPIRQDDELLTLEEFLALPEEEYRLEGEGSYPAPSPESVPSSHSIAPADTRSSGRP
jgi:hypothetical protein